MELREVVKAGKPLVFAENVTLLHQTEKAWKVDLKGQEIWFPKTVAEFVEELPAAAEKKPVGTILVLDWAWKSKMEKNGLTMKPQYVQSDDIVKYL